ncbi:MAG: pentapeptide repeat-containing protein, partial [Cyanobacteria bacterium J06576_12]
MNEAEVARQIYDLLGYGSLTVDTIDYLKEKLFAAVSSVDELLPLFQRLKQFYEDWCEGTFIDNTPSENWPQIKRMQLGAEDIQAGLRHIDIYAGLNVMRLLFELHRYGQQLANGRNYSSLHFHPCGNLELKGKDADSGRLLRIIGYSQLIGLDAFTEVIGSHLSCADLSRAYLSRAYFSSANFQNCNFQGANLSSANLIGSNLIKADLRSAYLQGADLRGANLSRSHLGCADLRGANFSGADFRSSNLIGANFRGANLSRANFSGANLKGADLSSTNLISADLSSADLTNVDLSDAYPKVCVCKVCANRISVTE